MQSSQRNDLYHRTLPTDANKFEHDCSSAFDVKRHTLAYLIVFALVIMLFGQCSNPLDVDGPRVVNPIDVKPEPDDPRFDTLRVSFESHIRFEAVIDKKFFALKTIPDSMRIGIIAQTRNDSIPYREIYSSSGIYLNLGTVTLPFEATIPAKYFLRYNNARIFIGYTILYGDQNKNKVYDYGETIYGVGERSVFAYAQGSKLEHLPPQIGKGVISGLNILSRTGGSPYAAEFTAAPDFYATILQINIRGANYLYDIPYAWKPEVKLIP